ncbi:MAG: CDGSH iron-sulfur domain-containing protein [Actinomycetales bacterium]|nr:CDGSH iron-sulfur domain-containing protein [Actinomycetales bacterium]
MRTDGCADVGPPVTVTVCPDGPLLVRGDVEIRTADGDVVPRGRSTVALCRCGRTGRAPWCDGTHKLGRRREGRPGR